METGTGYSTRRSSPANFQRPLDHGRPELPDTLAAKSIEGEHRHDCSASCSKCLREYGNQRYQHCSTGGWRWTWSNRGRQPAPDPTSDIAVWPNPWASVAGRVGNVLTEIRYAAPEVFAGLRAVHTKSDTKRVWVEIHPLRRYDHATFERVKRHFQAAEPAVVSAC